MPGPPPKDASVRARRNKTSTAARLPSGGASVAAPKLPARTALIEREGEMVEVSVTWHPRAVEWWKRAWRSPMAAEWLDSDVLGLELVAELWDGFYKTQGTSDRLKLAGEIRLQEQRFGLSPMDRRRLQWEVEKTEEARDRGRRRRTAPQSDAPAPRTRKPGADPRQVLQALPGGKAS